MINKYVRLLKNQKVFNVKLVFILFFLSCLVLSFYSNISKVNAAPQHTGDSITIINFDVAVDPGSASFVDRAVNNAITAGSSAIIIQMNTPGGLLSDMTAIITSIAKAQNSSIPVYTFVVPNGLAASAGSYIAMATNKIFMSPSSEIGPSTPIVVGGSALEQNHTQAAMLSYLQSLAGKWGRNQTAVFQMVQQDLAFTAQDALKYHVIDGIANSLNDVIANVSLMGQQTIVNESLYDQFLSAISNPTLDGILILLGIIAIVLDVYHPTVLLTVAGAVAIISGLIGAEIIGASVLGFLILAIAAVLIIVELKLGHGFAMMAGVILGAFGILYLAQGLSFSPSPITNTTELELFGVVVVGILAALYFRWMIGPIMRRSKLTGPESLIGQTGIAVTDLKPKGEVRVNGIIWRATSISGDILKDESVTVKSMKNLELIVEKTSAQPST